MPESLNKKIIELESKFSILISKYKKLEAINENLKKEITDREIDLILYKFNNANNSNLEILSSDEKSKLPPFKISIAAPIKPNRIPTPFLKVRVSLIMKNESKITNTGLVVITKAAFIGVLKISKEK